MSERGFSQAATQPDKQLQTVQKRIDNVYERLGAMVQRISEFRDRTVGNDSPIPAPGSHHPGRPDLRTVSSNAIGGINDRIEDIRDMLSSLERLADSLDGIA
jgi:hypothetical protein